MSVRYYVTILRDKRRGFLSGPYETHEKAERQVAKSNRRAEACDPWAAFDAFGVTMVDSIEPVKTIFGILEEGESERK